MRKGQVEHFFSDAIPGIIILLFAYSILAFATRDVTTSTIDTQRFQDTYDRALITFLHSPVTAITYVGNDKRNQHNLFFAQYYTYGDLLYLMTLDKKNAAFYRDAFASGLRSHLASVSALTFQTPSEWLLNVSSKDPFLVDSESGSLTPSFIARPTGQSSHLALAYPSLEEQIPLVVLATFGNKEYVAP